MNKIRISTIDHDAHRYDTVGDYWMDGDTVVFAVSETGNADYNFLVALHELVEAYLVQRRGVTFEAIDRFDMEFERNRGVGDLSEPGDHPDAPYRREHAEASTIERMMGHILGVDFAAYEDALSKLTYRRE